MALILAGLLEIAWAIGLKKSEGFTKLGPSLFTVVTLALSMYLLAWAARTLPIGTAYPVWVGIGAAGAVILGITMLHEPVTVGRMSFLVLLLVSIVGLRLTSP